MNERVAPYVSIVGFGFDRPCASITPAGIPEVYRKSYDTLAAGSAVAAASPPDSWLYTPPRWIDSLSSRRRRRAGGDGDGVTAGGGASGDGGGGATASAGGGGGGAMPVTQISTSGHSFHALPSPPRSLSRCSHSVVTSTKWMCGWLALHDEKPRCIAAFRSRHEMYSMKKKSSRNCGWRSSHSVGSHAHVMPPPRPRVDVDDAGRSHR